MWIEGLLSTPCLNHIEYVYKIWEVECVYKGQETSLNVPFDFGTLSQAPSAKVAARAAVRSVPRSKGLAPNLTCRSDALPRLRQ